MQQPPPPSPRKYDLDWSKADPENIKVILKQAELFLEAQLKIGLAADQRAMVTAGLFAGFAASIFAAVVAYWTRNQDVSNFVALFGVSTALIISVASYLSARCAVPTKFGQAGTQPKTLWESRKLKDFRTAIGGEIENYQERIDVNNKLLDRNAGRFRFAIMLAILAPAIGGSISLSAHHVARSLGCFGLWW